MTCRSTQWVRAVCVLAALAGPPADAETDGVRLPTAVRNAKGSAIEALDLRADRVVFAPAENCDFGTGRCPARLDLTGGVSVATGGATISAARVELQLDGAGSAVSLSATGGVRIALGEREGRARRARLVFSGGTLVLEGGASLRWTPSLRIDGERIAVDLKRGHVTVQRARARLGLLAGEAR